MRPHETRTCQVVHDLDLASYVLHILRRHQLALRGRKISGRGGCRYPPNLNRTQCKREGSRVCMWVRVGAYVCKEAGAGWGYAGVGRAQVGARRAGRACWHRPYCGCSGGPLLLCATACVIPCISCICMNYGLTWRWRGPSSQAAASKATGVLEKNPTPNRGRAPLRLPVPPRVIPPSRRWHAHLRY